jgi:hypothetical protein
MNNLLQEEITMLGRCIGRAMAQQAEDEASGYDVLASDCADEIRILRRTLGRLEGFVHLQEKHS